MLRATLAAGAAALLTACGSGIEVRLFIAFDSPPAHTSGAVVILNGVAALPAGSVRTGGTLLQPILSCQPGTFSITWTNDTNGTHGAVSALWDCPADQLTWSSGPIPLAPGDNRIRVRMIDSLGSATNVVSIRRE
ncbi:MAG TPA: hypothetical protein VGE10_13380 [Zeimonas sp.]